MAARDARVDLDSGRPDGGSLVMVRYASAAVLVLLGLPGKGCASRSGHASEASTTSGDGGEAGATATRQGGRSLPPHAIERAEDRRRAGEIEEGWLTGPDVLVRRRAIRALARIADMSSDATEKALLRGLGDEDLEVVGWAAYGLGWTCKGREEAHVRALSAREATLADADAGPRSSARDMVDAASSIVRAVGRCGGTLAEAELASLVRSGREDLAEQAAYALGSISGRKIVSDETMGALLDRARSDPARAATAAALFPIGRLDTIPEAWTPRIADAARGVLGTSGPLRAFAIRALEKVGASEAPNLGRVASSSAFSAPERAEAARALSRMGAPGREAAAVALAHALQDRTLVSPASLSSDVFNVLVALVDALGADVPKAADASLYVLSVLPLVPPPVPPGLHMRTVTLRCSAAAALARAAFDAAILAKCDPDPDGEIGERARLTALLRKPLVGERRKVFRALSVSAHVRVREAALEAIGQHPELEETGRALLVQGLAAEHPGVVATAALGIVQHPERVLVLAASERRAGLDPRAPPPSTHPAMELTADVRAALTRALERTWHEDAAETRTSLLDAAVAVSLPEGRALAPRACEDTNVTVREHAARALRALGAKDAACPQPAEKTGGADAGAPAAEPTLQHPVRVSFDIAGQKLAITFEPALTPLAAERFVSLARSGFYRGIVVHRVVPGYVVQFGDPGGDGYGGSGSLLRCETSPVPFARLDVGVALAGRDTGSSQLFVALSRVPHLDGDYARIGQAAGDWDAVAEGDVINDVKVEE